MTQVGDGDERRRVVTTDGRVESARWLWWYVALACLFSWAWWIPMAAAGVVSRGGQGWPTHLLGLTGPAVAAVVVTAVARGRPGLVDLWQRAVRWRVGLRWWLIVMVTLRLCGLGFAAGWWQGEPVPGRSLGVYSGAPAARGAALLVLLAYVLLVNGFGEEVGWRGFLAHHLLARWGRLRAASAVWLAWALWHAPLFLVGGSAVSRTGSRARGMCCLFAGGPQSVGFSHTEGDVPRVVHG